MDERRERWTTVSLRAIDDSNREVVEALRVSPGQEQFVTNVPEALAEAEREPNAHAL